MATRGAFDRTVLSKKSFFSDTAYNEAFDVADAHIDTKWRFLPTNDAMIDHINDAFSAAIAMPDRVLEAARIDGSGEVRIFFSVVLRMLTPVLVTVFLFQFVGIWNNYFLPLVMLSNDKLCPVTLGLTTWEAASTPHARTAPDHHRRSLCLRGSAGHRHDRPSALLAGWSHRGSGQGVAVSR